MKVGDLVKWRIGKSYPYQLGVVTGMYSTCSATVWFFEDHSYSIMTIAGLEVV